MSEGGREGGRSLAQLSSVPVLFVTFSSFFLAFSCFLSSLASFSLVCVLRFGVFL